MYLSLFFFLSCSMDGGYPLCVMSNLNKSKLVGTQPSPCYDPLLVLMEKHKTKASRIWKSGRGLAPPECRQWLEQPRLHGPTHLCNSSAKQVARMWFRYNRYPSRVDRQQLLSNRSWLAWPAVVAAIGVAIFGSPKMRKSLTSVSNKIGIGMPSLRFERVPWLWMGGPSTRWTHVTSRGQSHHAAFCQNQAELQISPMNRFPYFIYLQNSKNPAITVVMLRLQQQKHTHTHTCFVVNSNHSVQFCLRLRQRISTHPKWPLGTILTHWTGHPWHVTWGSTRRAPNRSLEMEGHGPL